MILNGFQHTLSVCLLLYRSHQLFVLVTYFVKDLINPLYIDPCYKLYIFFQICIVNFAHCFCINLKIDLQKKHQALIKIHFFGGTRYNMLRVKIEILEKYSYRICVLIFHHYFPNLQSQILYYICNSCLSISPHTPQNLLHYKFSLDYVQLDVLLHNNFAYLTIYSTIYSQHI